MKKLLFDDYQPTAGAYVVREIEQETRVVPSTKSGEPAPIQVRAESVREFTLLDFFDLDADATLRDIEPKSEFHSLLDKVLLVLKDVLFAHTVVLLGEQREKPVGARVDGDRQHSFMASRRFAMEADLVSNVALTGKAQMLGIVNPASQAELLRYYEGEEPQGLPLRAP